MRQRLISTLLLGYACSLIVACSDAADGSSDDGTAPSCESQVIATEECKPCACDNCEKEGIACADDATCAECFSSGNYTACAGQMIAEAYVGCLAKFCGCY
jgi:hypothetical protein